MAQRLGVESRSTIPELVDMAPKGGGGPKPPSRRASNAAFVDHPTGYKEGHRPQRWSAAVAKDGDDENPFVFDKTAAREICLSFVFVGACLTQMNGDSNGRFVGSLRLGTAAFTMCSGLLPLGAMAGSLAVIGPAHRHGRRAALERHLPRRRLV